MFLPMFQGEARLPLDADSFFTHLEDILTRIDDGKRYRMDRTGANTARITNIRFNPFGYRFNRAMVTALPDGEGGILVKYHVSFLKWFMAMLFLIFQVLVAFAVLSYMYISKLAPSVQSEAVVTLFIAMAFWTIVWPIFVTILYRVMVKRMFRMLILSAGIGSGLLNSSD